MILGLIEHDRGQMSKASLEMLAAGIRLAADLGAPFEVAAIGTGVEGLAGELTGVGLARAHLVQDDRLDDYAPDAWAESLCQMIDSFSPQAVIAAGTDRGNEVMARVAARKDLPMAANCIEIETGDVFVVKRVQWGGSLYEYARLHGGTKLLTIAPLTFEPVEISGGDSPEVHSFAANLEDTDVLVRVTGRIDPESGISLADARIVVGGGRGVGSAEGFGVLEDLAALLGGVVGGSRVATNNGWRPHAEQIGQTGTRISPDLYIACGISGAIQHWVGCMASKKILAINKDPESPIVAKADYAVIGDLHEVVPAICELLRR